MVLSGSSRPLEALDLLATTLLRHDRDLTALGNSLRKSIELLNTKRLVENHEQSMLSGVEPLLKKIEEVVNGLHALEGGMQKFENRSLKLQASTSITRTLAKSYQVLSEESGMVAKEIASLTGRSRALESIYLNQLSAIGLVEKTKKGRKFYYTKKPQAQFAGPEIDSRSVMLLILVSERVSKNSENIQDLISQRLSDLKDWKIERSTILPREISLVASER